MKPVKLASFAVMTGACALAFSGCSSTNGRPVVPHSHSGQMFHVEVGTVVNVREVVIDGNTDSSVGQWGGTIMGGALGSTVGHGAGAIIASGAGAVGGMIAGRHIEKAVTKADGYQITVQFDDGKQIMVVQETEKGGFMDGDRVRVMIGQNTTEVMH